jgi:hypothetical protein
MHFSGVVALVDRASEQSSNQLDKSELLLDGVVLAVECSLGIHRIVHCYCRDDRGGYAAWCEEAPNDIRASLTFATLQPIVEKVYSQYSAV